MELETMAIKKNKQIKKKKMSILGWDMTCRAFPTFDTIPEIDTRYQLVPPQRLCATHNPKKKEAKQGSRIGMISYQFLLAQFYPVLPYGTWKSVPSSVPELPGWSTRW